MNTVVGDEVFEFVAAFEQLRSKTQNLKSELQRLHAIRDWALEQQIIHAGDEVEILPSLKISPDSGWWGSREMLAPGQRARVTLVDHNSHYGYWYADIVPHEQWRLGIDGKRYDTDPSRLYTYAIPLRHLQAVIP